MSAGYEVQTNIVGKYAWALFVIYEVQLDNIEPLKCFQVKYQDFQIF